MAEGCRGYDVLVSSPISPRYLSVTVKQGTVKPAYNDLYLDRNLLRKTMK